MMPFPKIDRVSLTVRRARALRVVILSTNKEAKCRVKAPVHGRVLWRKEALVLKTRQQRKTSFLGTKDPLTHLPMWWVE